MVNQSRGQHKTRVHLEESTVVKYTLFSMVLHEYSIHRVSQLSASSWLLATILPQTLNRVYLIVRPSMYRDKFHPHALPSHTLYFLLPSLSLPPPLLPPSSFPLFLPLLLPPSLHQLTVPPTIRPRGYQPLSSNQFPLPSLPFPPSPSPSTQCLPQRNQQASPPPSTHSASLNSQCLQQYVPEGTTPYRQTS